MSKQHSVSERSEINDWKRVRLADVATKRAENVDPKEVDVERNVGLEHIEPNSPTPDWEPITNVTSTKRRFYPGDILFAKLRPNLEKAAQPEFDGVCSTDIFTIKAGEDVNSKYLLYRLSSKPAFDWARRTSAGTRMPRTSWDQFSNFEFELPPLEEQKVIASVLYNIDSLVEKNDELIEKSERFRRGYIENRVLGKPVEGPRKEGAIGTRRVTVPENWEMVRVEDVADVVSGNSFPTKYQNGNDGPHPVIRVEDMNLSVNDKYIKNVENSISESVLEELSKNLYPAGTVIHPRVGEALRLNKTRITDVEAAFDDNIMGWVPNEKVVPEFLYYASTLIDFNSIAQGGTVPSINKMMAGSFRIPLPPKSEQQEIADDMSNMDGLVAKYRLERQQLLEIKRGLLQDLLTGNVRTTGSGIRQLQEVIQYE